MHTPFLWSRLNVRLDKNIGAVGLKTILSRSCARTARLPLFLQILGFCRDTTRETVAILTGESDRWKRLTLSNEETESGYAEEHLSQISGNISILEHLSFKGFLSCYHSAQRLAAFRNAPSLKSLSTDDMSTHIMLP